MKRDNPHKARSIYAPLLALAVLLGACQPADGAGDAATGGSGSASGITGGRAAAAPASTPAQPGDTDVCADPRNPDFDPDACADPDASVTPFAGEWRVTRVHVSPDGVQAFVPDDPAIIGSRYRIDSAQIRWVHSASDGFTADDVCTRPSASPMGAIIEQEEGGALSSALRALGIAASARGQLHRFGCIDGGTWGPGEAGGAALFIPVGSDRMLMQWYDGVIVLAERTAP